jgi:fucose permease
MPEHSLSWSALNAEYNLLYILGLLLTFTSLFFVQSELYLGSYAVIAIIFRFEILFELTDKDSDYHVTYLAVSYCGTALGALLAACTANWRGRKSAVLLGSGLFIVGASIVKPS